MTEAPRKPFWKRKRWIAAGVLWLVIAYPVSEGPARYAEMRHWIPFTPAYLPLETAEQWVPGYWTFRWQWKQYWETLAYNHHAASLQRNAKRQESF
jgi:hypothetical protein